MAATANAPSGALTANADARPRARKSRARTTTRFAPPTLPSLSTAWSSIKQHLTPPSHPSTTSESANGNSSFNHTDLFYAESERGKDTHGTLTLLNPLAGNPGKHKRREPHQRRRPKSSGANSTSRFGDDEDPSVSHEAVLHTVVENDFEQFVPQAPKSESGSTNHTQTQDASGVGGVRGGLSGGGVTDEDDASPVSRSDAGSLRGARHWTRRNKAYEWIVERLWPNLLHFLDSSFPEPAKERAFQKESWFTVKQGAALAGLYFLVAWILTTSLLPQPLSAFNWGSYVGVGGFFTAPLLFMILFDYPRRHPWIYQPFLAGATWVFADIVVVEMKVCGYFSFNNRCGSRNFLYLFGWALGQPVLAVFAMKQSRPFAIIGACQWLVIVCALLMSEDNYPNLFYRNLVTFSLFHAFIIATSFMKERSDRQMFALRQQLKIQYRATQAAQAMERRAGDSKKRFVSYIFHEVRVPLNTALLAVQNLEGEEVFKGMPEDQAEMVHGLMGSLTMMEKVLNDVLSFNRMESGKFAQARRPFDFHKSIQLVALSHRMQAQMAGIELTVELDSAIDKIGGTFLGDEMRLRQVTSNLVSNSIKFTEVGGVRLVTKLLYPRMEPTPGEEIDDPIKIAKENALRMERGDSGPLDEKGLGVQAHVEAGGYGRGDVEKGQVVAFDDGRRNSTHSSRERDREREERNRYKALVRVEVHDTGVGLKKQDVIDNRLFSPYVQTEIGRRQGGKGSGLGLALVRQIVKLSNGRLGVESTYGKGSMFWFELPYSLPRPQRERRSTEAGSGATLVPPGGGTGPWGSNQYPPTPGRDTLPPIRHTFPAPAFTRAASYHHPPRVEGVDPRATGEAAARVRGASDHPAAGGASGGSRSAQASPRPAFGTTESTLPLLSPGLERGAASGSGGVARGSAGAGVPINASGVALDEIASSSFPRVPTTSTDSGGGGVEGSGAGAGPGVGLLRGEGEGDGESPEMVVEQRDPFGVVQAAAPRRSSEMTSGGAVPGPATGRTRGVVPAESPGGAEEDEATRPLCTLVVDDDKLTRMLMSRMLTRLGHQVTTAENGRMALELLADSFEGREGVPRFEVVFLDNQMPLMSGVEVASAVREMGNHIYIAGCTGNALREDQDEYIAAGADDILPKPIHQKAVLAVIEHARRRARGETSWEPVDEDGRRG